MLTLEQYMRSYCKKFLLKINYFFAHNARLGLILDGESEFAVKIDLSTHLRVGRSKLWVFGPFLAKIGHFFENLNELSVARKRDMEI